MKQGQCVWIEIHGNFGIDLRTNWDVGGETGADNSLATHHRVMGVLSFECRIISVQGVTARSISSGA